jgi:hypothetical protein
VKWSTKKLALVVANDIVPIAPPPFYPMASTIAHGIPWRNDAIEPNVNVTALVEYPPALPFLQILPLRLHLSFDLPLHQPSAVVPNQNGWDFGQWSFFSFRFDELGRFGWHEGGIGE